MHTLTTVVTPTTKGNRVWFQGLAGINARWCGGTRYTVNYTKDTIHIIRDSVGGKRKVTASKGGIIDLQSNKVTRAMGDATHCTVTIDNASITIQRVTA